jgi:hypothetical protein
MRTTRELRERLEREAADSGRSLVQEVEFRLERSFRDEDTLIEAFGGRDTCDVLRVMGSVAAQIKTRKGKTAADWKTGLAIYHAWKRLIHDWVPRPPAEFYAEVERLFDDVPDAPKRPVEPARGGLLVPRASEEEWEAYRESLPNFVKDCETFFIKFDKYKAASRKIEDEVKKAAGIGEEAALGLLSDPEK